MDRESAAGLCRFAENASAGLDGTDARRWRARLDDAYPELETALEWLLAQGDDDGALTLASALEKYWVTSGRLAEGRGWLDRALSPGHSPDASRGRGLFSLGMLAFWQGDDAASRAAHDNSLAIAERIHDPNLEALALTGVARLALRAGDIEGARALCARALQTAAGSADRRGRSSALHVASVAAQMNGDLGEARDLMQQRLDLERAAGSLRLVAAECSNLSGVERQLGNYETARRLALEAIDLEEQQGDVWSLPYTLNQLAAIHLACGSAPRAATLLAAASRLVEEQGAEWPPDEAPVYHQTRTACISALEPDQFDQMWASGKALTWQQAVATASQPA